MKCLKIAIFFTCQIICITVFAQNSNTNLLDSFSGKLITAIRSHEKARAYLATDKSIYNSGDYIWFRAFLLNTISQKINVESGYLFVDLVDEKDSVLKLLILDAYNKQLDSRIELPNTVTTGYYWLRAYTKQMAKIDSNSIGIQPLYILGKKSEQVSSHKIKTGNIDSTPIITFYPEGGSVITGINSRVGLQATIKNGAAVSTDGFIKDSRDSVIAKFTTNTNGLAQFDFEPSGFRRYKAVVNWHGREIYYPMPPFDFFKGQISVTKQASDYKLRILLGDSIYKKDVVTYVLGISKDSMFFAGVGNGVYEMVVKGDQIPYGIGTFYLFDQHFNLLSERSVYAKATNVNTTLGTNKAVYAKGEKIELNISVADAAQHAIPSVIALSVNDARFSDLSDQCSFPIPKNILETIDNGFLAGRACYSEQDVDLMMLVKKSIYDTISKTINRPPFNNSPYPDSLLFISGRVFNEKNQPSVNKILTLISDAGDMAVFSDTTDNAGRFCFPFQNYKDSTKFIIDLKNSKGNVEVDQIILDSFPYPHFTTPVALKQYLSVEPKQSKKLSTPYELAEDSDKNLLAAVVVQDGKKAINYNASKRVSASSTILTAPELDERISVGTSILKVGGLHVINGLLVINGPSSTSGFTEPLLMVDGAQVFTVAGIDGTSPVLNYLNSLNAKDIDFIEVLKGGDGASYGVRGGNGVILVNMLSSRRDITTSKNNLKEFYAKGLSYTVPFPSLIANSPTNQDTNEMVHKRSTLFWNGNYLTSETKHSSLFLCSGAPATYKCTISGVTVHGDIIYKTVIFQIK